MFTACTYQGYMFKDLDFVNIWMGKPPVKVNLQGVNSKSACRFRGVTGWWAVCKGCNGGSAVQCPSCICRCACLQTLPALDKIFTRLPALLVALDHGQFFRHVQRDVVLDGNLAGP